jgi:PAP2 superfamily
MKTKPYDPHSSGIKLAPAFILLIVLIFNSVSCKKVDSVPDKINSSLSSFNSVNSSGALNSSMLMLWNDAATQAVARAGNGPNGPLPPMPESYIYALVNVAMHDALNSISPKYKTYALLNTINKDADPNAAVAKAAHDIIVALLPPLSAYADSLYQVSLNSIANGNKKTQGIIVGQEAAAAMLAKRSNDGFATAQIPYVQGTLPGQYRSTPPFDGPPFNGFVAVPGWGKITPFGVASASQFRPVPPYPINTPQYTTDYNEIKSLGTGANSTRTADQTQIGLFWLENSPHSFNRLARELIFQKKLDAWTAARLLGVLHMALADANISSLEAKFYYNYWRPITAVRLGDVDGNASTIGNQMFDILAPPTPPIPDYPSNHAVNGAAAAQVLTDFFGPDFHFSAISTSLPNVTRNYKSFIQAAHENALSRIYVGYHFRNAVNKGEAQGYLVGDYVFKNALKGQ